MFGMYCEKDLKDNKHRSLHLARKYARIFVLGHYLFLKAHSSPRTTLSENCSLRFSDLTTHQIFSLARDWSKTHNVTEYSPAKNEELRVIFPNFQNRGCCEKYSKDNKHNSLHLFLEAQVPIVGEGTGSISTVLGFDKHNKE